MMLAPAVHCGMIIISAGVADGVQRRWAGDGMGTWNLHWIFGIALELELEQDLR
jgi:hypothetical protein